MVISLSERHKPKKSEKESLADNLIERYAGSSIYFMLEKEDFSTWHRLKSDEVWHYYDGGSPIDIYIIDNNGKLKIHTLGNPGITENASFQIVVPAGVLFAAEVSDKLFFGLVGCTVSPAFEYEDFELVNDRNQLVKLYPDLINIIDKFIKLSNQSSNKQNYESMIGLDRNKISAKDYIEKLKMERHQEGGHFSLNYKSTDPVNPLYPTIVNKILIQKLKIALQNFNALPISNLLFVK